MFLNVKCWLMLMIFVRRWKCWSLFLFKLPSLQFLGECKWIFFISIKYMKKLQIIASINTIARYVQQFDLLLLMPTRLVIFWKELNISLSFCIAFSSCFYFDLDLFVFSSLLPFVDYFELKQEKTHYILMTHRTKKLCFSGKPFSTHRMYFMYLCTCN